MGQARDTWPREDAPQRGGLAGRGQNLRDLANEEYCTKGRQGRQIVCLIYTFIAWPPNVEIASRRQPAAERIPAPRIGGAEHCARSLLYRLPIEAEQTHDRRVDQPAARDKALVELYQGIIAMPVCIGAGLTFERLYDSRRRGEACGCPHGRQETTLQDKFLIAVVDDDVSMREAVKGLLRSLGYDAVTFGRAEDFLNFDRRGRVDCLIADVQMPGLTGPDLHARLVASGESVRTILITAYPDPVARKRALRAGVKCYLTKPFRDEDLQACIRSALDSDAAFDRRPSREAP